MPNIVIYAPPYKNQAGKIVQPSMRIVAVNNFKYYTSYPYFSSKLSEKPLTVISDCSSESSANEHLLRAYRVTEFADATCFKPVKFTSPFHNLLERVWGAGSCDHPTCWISSLGTKFILNEPYNTDPNYFLNLGQQGLIAIILPTNLSPYCGSWDPTPGAEPKTKSYLICDYKNLEELKGLEICLRNAIYKHSSLNLYTPSELVPEWNCTKEVNHD